FPGTLFRKRFCRLANFSRPNRSFIDRFKGRSETKSRAVSLSATVALTTFPAIFMFIVLSAEASLALLRCSAWFGVRHYRRTSLHRLAAVDHHGVADHEGGRV